MRQGRATTCARRSRARYNRPLLGHGSISTVTLAAITKKMMRSSLASTCTICLYFSQASNRPDALSENRMTPSQPRIGQINAKLTCDFFIQNSYERQSDAPPHVRASPCAAAARIDLKLCTAAICDFRHQIHAFAPREKDGKTVFGPPGNFARIRRI